MKEISKKLKEDSHREETFLRSEIRRRVAALLCSPIGWRFAAIGLRFAVIGLRFEELSDSDW